VIDVTRRGDGRHDEASEGWLKSEHQNRGCRANTEGTTMAKQATTSKAAKGTNYEGKFFGMIVLAWAVLAVLFNIAHSALPQAKDNAAAKKPVAAAKAAPVDRVASVR
jgi:hypothetical protein